MDGDTATAGIALLVQQQYRAPDLVAAGALSWVGPDGVTYVLVDVQSTTEGIVQARADLWEVVHGGIVPVGRSEVMAAAAEIGAYSFDDLTGDGLPDLLGYVADSAGVSYPVFIPGAHGAMGEELAPAAPGWRFATDTDSLPRAARGSRGAGCYLQLWAEPPLDGRGDGWRYLPLLPGGRLGPPGAAVPECP